MGLSVIPGGSGSITVPAENAITRTIFHNCCSREQTGRANSCRFKLYYATVILYNIEPEVGIVGNPGNVIVTFALYGEPIQLDCFEGPIVLAPGDNVSLAVAITFDQILLTFLPPPPTTTLRQTEVLYRISLGMCPA